MPTDHWWARAIGHELRRGWPALAALLVVFGGAWAAIELTDEVVDGTTQGFDRAVLMAFRTGSGDLAGPGWMQEMMRDFTALGGIGILTFITLAVVGYELLERRGWLAVTVLVAVLGGVGVSTLIKRLVDRARPDLVTHAVEASSPSFPSGHSMMAATVYLTLAALLVRFRSRRATAVHILTAATVATALVGVSRVYLGVHWPTDVIAGWTIGATWALLVWFGSELVDRHRSRLGHRRLDQGPADGRR